MERLFTLKTPLRVSHFKLSRADACVAELLAELVAEEDVAELLAELVAEEDLD